MFLKNWLIEVHVDDPVNFNNFKSIIPASRHRVSVLMLGCYLSHLTEIKSGKPKPQGAVQNVRMQRAELSMLLPWTTLWFKAFCDKMLEVKTMNKHCFSKPKITKAEKASTPALPVNQAT